MAGQSQTQTLPPIRGTRSFQLARFQADDSTTFEEFHTITVLDQYQHYSFEELRLNDYTSENRGVIVRPSIGRTFLSETTNGLAPARSPSGAGVYTPCFARRTLAKDTIDFGAAVITFRVGADQPKDFVVHETLAAARSHFIRLAMSKDWKEARDRVTTLPDDLPETFRLYQQYVYTNNIASNYFGDNAEDAAEYRLLVNAYILGERFIDLPFKDAIADATIHKLRGSNFFDPRLTNLVYDHTPSDSRLRKLWVDVYVWAGNPGWLDEDVLGGYVNAEFALDLSRYQMKLASGLAPNGPAYIGSPCDFHEHAGGMCYRG